ncbi:MAG TPA: 4Fe-4S dicluster domain-containing protein [Planctomycetota bacterium]|nr:4Fe-4S dicluster domain-containing protein [Planctomycetota bacterium]
MIDPGLEFFIDPSRCIGCQSCFHACAECDTHRGTSMIHLEYVDRAESVQTVPVVCMHCEDPACANACPADAIKKTADGIVQSALQSRCIGCSNCVLACPFGVPQYVTRIDQMMKCDQCYDRTSTGKRPMCVTVCPSGALAFGTRAEIERLRRERPMDVFRFGPETVLTKVQMMMPAGIAALEVDVADLVAEGGGDGGAQGLEGRLPDFVGR